MPKFSSVVENSHDYWSALKFILWKVFIIWSENDNTARMDITGGRYCVIIIKKKSMLRKTSLREFCSDAEYSKYFRFIANFLIYYTMNLNIYYKIYRIFNV